MIELNSYTLAGALRFWRVGETFTTPYAGNPNQADRIVAIDAWPAANDPAMAAHDIGESEGDCKWKKTVESIKPRKAVLGRIKLKQVVYTYQEYSLEVTTNAMTRLAFELFFGSAAQLTDAVSQFTPGESYPKEGMLSFNAYTNEGEWVFTGAVWVHADCTDGLDMSGRDIVKPKFEFMKIDSDLETMSYGSESQLTA